MNNFERYPMRSSSDRYARANLQYALSHASQHLLPASAVQSRTDFGKPGYGGPCPPVGDKPHRYIFTVFALKTDKLPLEADTGPAMVGFYLNQQKLGTASITAYYGR